MLGPRREVERRSQLVKADAEHTDAGMKPDKLVFEVRDSDDIEAGRDAGAEV